MIEALEAIGALVALATAGIILALDTEDRASAQALVALLLFSGGIMVLAHAADVYITKGVAT